MANDLLDSLKSAWGKVAAFFKSTEPQSLQCCAYGPYRAVTPEEAKELMSEFKNLDYIPFDYPTDCCYSRAHEMCRLLKSKGISCGKVWNYASQRLYSGGIPLSVYAPAAERYQQTGLIEWGYHVAPTVPVLQDGKVQSMVLDPSMFAAPVTPQQWKDAQNDPNSLLVESDDKPYYRDQSGELLLDEDYSQTQEKLSDHRKTRDRVIREKQYRDTRNQG